MTFYHLQSYVLEVPPPLLWNKVGKAKKLIAVVLKILIVFNYPYENFSIICKSMQYKKHLTSNVKCFKCFLLNFLYPYKYLYNAFGYSSAYLISCWLVSPMSLFPLMSVLKDNHFAAINKTV